MDFDREELMQEEKWLVALGVLILAASLTFPAWSLHTYEATVEAASDPTEEIEITENMSEDDREDVEEQREAMGDKVVEFEELTPREQEVVEKGRNRAGTVTLYGGWYSHQDAESSLPFSDMWLRSYTLGAYVNDDGSYYEVRYGAGGVPFHFPLVMGGGIVVGLVVLGLRGLVKRAKRGSERTGWSTTLAAIGLIIAVAALVFLGWLGNIEGYLWPIQ